MRLSVAQDPKKETLSTLINRFCCAARAVGADVEVLGADQLAIRLREIVSSGDTVFCAASLRRLVGSALDDVPDDAEPQSVFGLAWGAIARTGTVIVAEARHGDRLAFMLARRHVLVVSANLIVSDLHDSSAVLHEALTSGAKYVTFVTGPSRTSDIEMAPTIGAHGPRELLLLVVITEVASAD